MAGLITVRLSRSDAQPWGFRLQGGKDFGQPLLIQKVNGGSLAEKSGLQVADAVIKVNGQDVFNLRHKDAQDVIVKGGNSFEVVVSRGPGGTWKPSVSPIGSVPAPSPVGGAPAPVTKTSLAYKGPASPLIGAGHNTAARPFSTPPQLNGMSVDTVKSITSKQYNNPVNLYSDQTIAETLSAQAEVLAGGVMGVNFMKNEKAYNSNNSEVLKMVQEIDSEPRTPEPVEPAIPSSGGVVIPPPVSGLRHVFAPENKPPSTTPSQSLPPGQNICADCERLIVGVFVRIKDKNLHVECFKCATCGTSLKNVGYYNINNKLYCDVHAKLAARANPPGPNLDPVTIPPGGHIPSGVVPVPFSAAPLSPQPSTMAPMPFHAPRGKPSHVSAPRVFKAPAPSLTGPKPFGAPAAPVSYSAAPPVPAPFSGASHVPAPFSAPAPFSPPAAPVLPPFATPAQPPFNPSQAPSFPSFPKTLPGLIPNPLGKKAQSEPAHPSSKRCLERTAEIEDISCCFDKSKRMSVCSNEVCELSGKKSALKAMSTLAEEAVRASPIPFNRDDIVSESYRAAELEALRQSQNVEKKEEGNVQITRKTKVEESFVRSQKMYTAEISSSSQSRQVRAASPEMEQIMEKSQAYQSYHDTQHHKPLQSDRCLTPEIENIMAKPHGSWSPMPPACMVRPITPGQIISYPPDIPPNLSPAPRPRVATPEQFQEARDTVERFVDHTKHVKEGHSVPTGQTSQTFSQQSAFSSYSQHSNGQQTFAHQSYTQQSNGQQQYIPRFDGSQGFSAYVGNGNSGNHNEDQSYYSQSAGGQVNQGNGNQSYSQCAGGQGNINHGNGNHGSNGNGHHHNNESGNVEGGNRNDHNSGNRNQQEEEPTITEPDEPEDKSRKSSRSEQGQKSSRKPSSTEEESSSRRVFSDFGGPQISSSVDIESTTEGGVQKTSVTKSQKKEYASCEFESTRKSTVKHHDSSEVSGSDIKITSGDSRKHSEPSGASKEEENMTKSQVEEIIKQELNKVFNMAQTMEKTDYSKMYDQKSQHKSSEKSSSEAWAQSSKKTEYKPISYGEVITNTGKLTSGLTIAPARPFTPQGLESNYPLPYQNIPSDCPLPRTIQPAEPPPSKSGYIPLMGVRPDSPLIHALTIAPERPYSPLQVAPAPAPPTYVTQSQRSSMLEALTTAPSTPYHLGTTSEECLKKTQSLMRSTESKQESFQKYTPKPEQKDFKPILKTEPKAPANYVCSSRASETCMVQSFPPVTNELKSAFKSTSKVQSTTFAESEKRQTDESKLNVKAHQRSSSTSRVERPITPSGLNPPNYLPYYQQHIGEIPLAHRSNSPIPHQIKAPSITPPPQRAPSMERRGSVKAMSDAYTQQLNQQQQQQQQQQQSSVSYVSSGAYSSGSVTKSYSYEQEHKSIDAKGYHASPLAGKLPLAGEHTYPKCSSPVLGKLDHTKQVFKPAVPPPSQPARAFQSPVAEQANLKQAPPFFTQEKNKPPTPWSVVKDNDSSFKPPQPQPTPPRSLSIPHPSRPSLPTFPEPPKPFSLPGVNPPSDAGPGTAKGSSTAGTVAPRRGRGVLNAAVGAGGRVPLCGSCNSHIRGPFITALGKIWCPEHFTCVNTNCRRPLQDIGFVEDPQGLYCEFCFEKYLAPSCSKCNAKVKGDCLNAIGKHFHPECFTCAYCGKLFGNNPFFLEDALPYCEADWNELFTTKCFSCGFPIEAGDRWVEALNNNYHSQCFNCTSCKKNLEGQSFFAKGGRPFCKNHAR